MECWFAHPQVQISCVFLCVCMHARVRVCMCVRTCMRVCMHVCMHECMCVCLCEGFSDVLLVCGVCWVGNKILKKIPQPYPILKVEECSSKFHYIGGWLLKNHGYFLLKFYPKNILGLLWI